MEEDFERKLYKLESYLKKAKRIYAYENLLKAIKKEAKKDNDLDRNSDSNNNSNNGS